MLTPAIFPQQQVTFFCNNLKNFFRPGCRDVGDPDARGMKTRVSMKPKRGCKAIYQPCSGKFYALFLLLIWRNMCFCSQKPLCP